MADAIPVLMAYVDTRGVYQFVNEAYERWLGISKARIIGRKVKDVLGARAWGRTGPELRKALKGEASGYESFLDFKKVGRRFVSVRYTPDHDARKQVRGVVAWIEDITAQRAAEAANHRELTFSATLLKTTAALIVVLDPKGRVVLLNQAFEQATGYASPEVAGRDFIECFLVPDEVSGVRNVFRQLRNGQAPSTYVNHIRTRDGRKRLVEWSNNVICSENGSVEHVIGTGVDITERRNLENELLAAAEREQQRIGQDLHDSVGQKLTGLEISLHRMKREIGQFSETLAERCDKLSRGLRDVAREVRILSHGLVPVSFRAEGLCVALESLAAETNSLDRITCRFSCAGTICVSSSEHAHHLYRIAQEAVANALKHAKPSRIDIALARRGPSVELLIRDNGRGFGKSAQVGLGLRLMKKRAELIGGTMEIRSSTRTGTAIHCRVADSE